MMVIPTHSSKRPNKPDTNYSMVQDDEELPVEEPPEVTLAKNVKEELPESHMNIMESHKDITVKSNHELSNLLNPGLSQSLWQTL